MWKVVESQAKVTVDTSGISGWRSREHVLEAEEPETAGGRNDGWWSRCLGREEGRTDSYSKFRGGEVGGKAICSERPG